MCLTHELWSDLNDQIHNFLKGVDLASLAEKSMSRRLTANKIAAEHSQNGIATVQILD
jgi:DNA-binding IscR family transcriptional regulator